MFIRGSKLNLTLSHRLERKVETISNWTSSPAEVYHGDRSIAPRRKWISLDKSFESKKTIDLRERKDHECYAVPHVLRVSRTLGRDSSAKPLDT